MNRKDKTEIAEALADIDSKERGDLEYLSARVTFNRRLTAQERESIRSVITTTLKSNRVRQLGHGSLLELIGKVGIFLALHEN